MQSAQDSPGETKPAALARVPVALENLILSIDALDAEGRGVARNHEGKVVFVEGALPGERVACRIFQKKPKFDVARAMEVLSESAGRRAPRCPHFGVCGGCATQHADAATQMAAKQRSLEDNLARIGKVQPEMLLPIVYGEEWGYRRRARLSVRRVEKKGGVMVGFRERRSTHVADMRECHVLPENISRLVPILRNLIEQLSIRERVPQIELAAGDNATVLVFRHLLPLSETDLSLLRRFGDENAVHVWPQPGERVADLFCGLGNFSLPIATRAAQVVGFEGSRELVERARQNASDNRLVVQFEVLNLFRQDVKAYGPFQKM